MNSTATTKTSGNPLRWSGFLYSVISYGLGVLALIYWILLMLGVVSFEGGGIEGLGSGAAIAVNLGLLFLFALQHSVMARPSFKEKWVKIIGKDLERSTYVLATAVFLLPLLFFWQPMSTVVWDIAHPLLSKVIWAMGAAAWAYLFLATFAINHFELFGLLQGWEYANGRSARPVPFKERLMYKFDRHPIMTGAILGMWLAPTMMRDHLFFAAGLTLYIIIGVYFEERSLHRQWGDTYQEYTKRVGSIVPRLYRP